ncbi:MAG: hypothetical protein DWQ41_21820 [Planctomycetota bacterium]|nr:MAG: hypothetical protein DWQ41_21820 [Planctomycetota bacterium]
MTTTATLTQAKRQNKRMNASRNRPGWLASLGNVNSRPRYPKRSATKPYAQTMASETEYANTDFDLKSATPFGTLQRELDESCCVLHYTHGEDGHWHSIVESSHEDENCNRNAELDIAAILEAIHALSPVAKSELDACYLREFNIGFHCWDTWAYVHTLPHSLVRAIADANCTIAVTLYPMRNPDGTRKE